jgi:hypothetical protein
VIFRKGAAAPEHSVSCFRLTREWRSKILSGAAALDEAQESLAHPVRQERFARDPLARWDIDVQEGEERVLRLLSFSAIPWGRWLKSGRGVELSKWGKVVLCPGCGRASPLPRPPRLCLCGACGRRFMSDSVEQQQITRPLRGGDEGWHPLIVGEDVDRYRCIPGREIRLGVEGINYKNSDTFRMRKLLVRKTGVGIKAAIDESGAYTNQVVFHYTPAGDAPPFLLDYLLGVLCSRVLFAYHLKRLGENEWRSHPYVTQKVIEALPVPEIREGTWQWAQAQAIAEAAGRRSSVDRNDGEDDLQVERLVAGLYGLSTEDCAWVLGVLDGAQSLEPMRALRLPDPALLRPVRVP